MFTAVDLACSRLWMLNKRRNIKKRVAVCEVCCVIKLTSLDTWEDQTAAIYRTTLDINTHYGRFFGVRAHGFGPRRLQLGSTERGSVFKKLLWTTFCTRKQACNKSLEDLILLVSSYSNLKYRP